MNKILLVIMGICIGITGVYVFWFYQLSTVVFQDHTTVTQVVDFLNKQIQASQPVAPVKK